MGPDEEPQQPDLACPRCDRPLDGMNPRRRVRHLANHRLELRWACQHCSYKTPRWRDMRRHARQRHQQRAPAVWAAYQELPPRSRSPEPRRRRPHGRRRSTSVERWAPAERQRDRPAAQDPTSPKTRPQPPAKTSTPAKSPQISPLMGPDFSWTELERFLYEPSPEELQRKMLAQPADDRRRAVQALLASLDETSASEMTSSSQPSSGQTSSSQPSSGQPSSSSPDPSSVRDRATQTEGYVLVVHAQDTVHVNLALGGGIPGAQ